MDTFAVDRSIASYIRSSARRMFVWGGSSPVCARCGYAKHIEVCHIRPVASFTWEYKITRDPDAFAGINDPENLIVLCRNCHWEMDHGRDPVEDGSPAPVPPSDVTGRRLDPGEAGGGIVGRGLLEERRSLRLAARQSDSEFLEE